MTLEDKVAARGVRVGSGQRAGAIALVLAHFACASGSTGAASRAPASSAVSGASEPSGPGASRPGASRDDPSPSGAGIAESSTSGASSSAAFEGGAPARPSSAAGASSRRTAPSTIAEASAACERVHENRQVPVSCATDYVDAVPSIIVGFRDADDAQRWMRPFYERVAGPFCDAANRSGREARVYLTIGVGSAQRARRYSCEFGKWGEWFSAAPGAAAATGVEVEAAPPQALADAVQACRAVQANREVPVSCGTRVVNGVPAMIVGFRSPDDVQTYLEPIATRVAGPFCDAANRLGRRAALYVMVAKSRARHFDCEAGEWGEWFELQQQDPTIPTLIPG